MDTNLLDWFQRAIATPLEEIRSEIRNLEVKIDRHIKDHAEEMARKAKLRSNMKWALTIILGVGLPAIGGFLSVVNK